MMFEVNLDKELKRLKKKVVGSFVAPVRYKLHDIFVANSADDIFLEFVNKKVVVIGPGEAPTKELEAAVRAADICILVNKGYRSGHFFGFAKKAKEVILFHCLNEDEERGGGVLDELILAEINVEKIIYPLSEKKLHHHYLKASRKLNKDFEILSIKKGWYEKIVHRLDGYRPNTGFAALALLIQSGCEDLYIHGFTFFRTPYQSHYRDNLTNASHAISAIESAGNHNPDKDLLLFKELIKDRQKIRLANVTKSIVDAPFDPIFYQ
ncbi:glycosyltransferase family 29 protein [Spiribacter roseus]|uniref:Glycosyltransferase family 29 protein n=1 Tax=Spiribacter roseus TaxID=1855875 RepID=A0ABV3RX68_9GAMM